MPKADPHIDFCLTLDRPRVLRANARSLALFKEITGVDFFAIDLDAADLYENLRTMIGLLFCLAREMDPAADMKAIGESVTPELFPQLKALIRDAKNPSLSGAN